MFRGERFEVDLGQDDGPENAPRQPGISPGAFVNDVLERKPAAPSPPTAPTLKNKTGFPEHGAKRAQSRFKQGLSTKTSEGSHAESLKVAPPATRDAGISQTSTGGKALTFEEEERARIDRENNDRLAEMSAAEIEQERRELMSSLSPEMIQKLLQRSTIESGSAETDLSKHREPVRGSSMKQSGDGEVRAEKKVAFAAPEPELEVTGKDEDGEDDLDEDEGAEGPPSTEQLPANDSIHFPRPSQPPDLDPSSSTFLTDLHAKYFPSLPSDPEKLEWMQQSSTPQDTSAESASKNYLPTATGIEPKDLRFSFKGALIPPSRAATIPVTAGLHHHGDAPEAAGYTIPELCHLSRSSYAPQRCIAFQTLGRLLYRLGSGAFGDASEGAGTVGSEDSLGALARGMWRELEAEKVTEMLVRESEGRGVDGGRHVSARAYATEAVWLWQRGGGRKMGAE